MKLKKSQLKNAIKAIARDCLNERMVREQEQDAVNAVNNDEQANIERVVSVVVKGLPQYKSNADKLSMVAAELYFRQYNTEPNQELLQQAVANAIPADTEDECAMDEASYKQVAPHAYSDVNRRKAQTIQTDPRVNETGRPTLPPNKGAYKQVAPHAYSDMDRNKSLTIQTDPRVNENDKWIQGAVKHPGRCANMGSSECPAGSPQYNLAKRFKGGDIHKDNLKNEAGLTSEKESPEGEDPFNAEAPFKGTEDPFKGTNIGGEEQYDEREEIKLIKVMKLVADKLETMHKGMPGDDEPLSLSTDTEEPSDPDLPDMTADGGDYDDGCGLGDTGGGGDGESFSEPKEPSSAEDDKEPEEPKDDTKSKKKGKKEEDPTEFTKKLAKEYKVQKRSYRTSNDTSNDPKNLVDPEVPST